MPSQTGILQLGSPAIAFKNRLSMHNVAKQTQKVNTSSFSPQYKNIATGVDPNLAPDTAFKHYNELINSRNLTTAFNGGTAPEIQLRASNTLKNES